jgi:transcription antitermination factor NusA-like protein
MTVIDIQKMRYINLLDRVSRVKTSKCFFYNNCIFFAVPKSLISRAIGLNASNIRQMQDQLQKRIKIVSEPESQADLEQFIVNIVAPVNFKSLEIKEGTVIITAGPQSKAALLGRNKRRFLELEQIVKDIFHLDLRII